MQLHYVVLTCGALLGLTGAPTTGVALSPSTNKASSQPAAEAAFESEVLRITRGILQNGRDGRTRDSGDRDLKYRNRTYSDRRKRSSRRSDIVAVATYLEREGRTLRDLRKVARNMRMDLRRTVRDITKIAGCAGEYRDLPNKRQAQILSFEKRKKSLARREDDADDRYRRRTRSLKGKAYQAQADAKDRQDERFLETKKRLMRAEEDAADWYVSRTARLEKEFDQVMPGLQVWLDNPPIAAGRESLDERGLLNAISEGEKVLLEAQEQLLLPGLTAVQKDRIQGVSDAKMAAIWRNKFQIRMTLQDVQRASDLVGEESKTYLVLGQLSAMPGLTIRMRTRNPKYLDTMIGDEITTCIVAPSPPENPRKTIDAVEADC